MTNTRKRYSVQTLEGVQTDATNVLKLAELAVECNAIAGGRVIDVTTGQVVFEIPRWTIGYR